MFQETAIEPRGDRSEDCVRGGGVDEAQTESLHGLPVYSMNPEYRRQLIVNVAI